MVSINFLYSGKDIEDIVFLPYQNAIRVHEQGLGMLRIEVGFLSDSGCFQPDVRSWKGGPGFVRLSVCPFVHLSSCPVVREHVLPVVLFLSGKCCEQLVKPIISMNISSQITVD